MRSYSVRNRVFGGAIAGAMAAAALAAPLAAQSPTSVVTGGQSTFSITPYAGYMWFGNLAEYTTAGNVSNDDNWVVGGQAKVQMTSRWAVAGNMAYTRTNFQLERTDPSGGTTTIPSSGKVGYWLMDADLQYMLPFGNSSGRIAPFVQAGIGAVRYTVDPKDFSSENRTDLAFNAGVGIEADAGPVGIQLMLKDYITSLDWSDFHAFADAVQDNTIDRKRVANNLALTAGLRLSF